MSNFHLGGHDEISSGRSALYTLSRDQINSQKAMSLPSSPHGYRSQASERTGASDYSTNNELVLTWNKVLESSMFQNKPLLPYQEWNIDFSELTVGTRVGIGKPILCNILQNHYNGTIFHISISKHYSLQFSAVPLLYQCSCLVDVCSYGIATHCLYYRMH